MKVRITAAAESDLRGAAEFYNQQEAGLGSRLLMELSDEISSLRYTAGIHARDGIYHRLVSKTAFPYLIFYKIESDTALVSAVFDARRDPATLTRTLKRRV